MKWQKYLWAQFRNFKDKGPTEGGDKPLHSQFNTHEENLIISAAAKGDREAFGQLVRLYERLVLNTVRAKVDNETDALDVSQEVFIKVWRSLPNYRGDCRFSTWIYKISANACFDFLRKEARSQAEPLPTFTDKDGDEVTTELADDSIGSLPEEAYERSERIRAVRAAIASLSVEQREVVVLRDIEGRSYEEISEMLELEIGTVKSRLNRARGALKELLSELYAESVE